MSDTASNTEEVRRAVTAAILEAVETAILPRFQSLDTADISTKSGPNDFVTIADQEAEEILSARLRTIRSDAAVVGEEAAAEDPDILTRLRRPGAAWVIDPIDGTGNFVAGQDAFAVVVALVEDGKTQMGWIHHPLSGDTIWAAVGEGVWQGSEQLAVRVPSEDSVSSMSASIYHRAFRSARSDFARTERLGSAAHEYWMMVHNHLHVTTFSRLMPWDHAAGVLIHSEAGGYTAMLDNTPYQPGNEEQLGLLSAPSQDIWNAVRALADEDYV